MESDFRHILLAIHPEASESLLEKTPARATTAFKKLTQGHGSDPERLLSSSLYENDQPGTLVTVTDIPFMSLCEHHLLPFLGTCDVEYVAAEKIVGLSKIHDLVEILAHRLQLQETLTQDITMALDRSLHPMGARVSINAEHSCLRLIHPGDHRTKLRTSFATGCLSESIPARSSRDVF